jgi:hypothetical protein
MLFLLATQLVVGCTTSSQASPELPPQAGPSKWLQNKAAPPAATTTRRDTTNKSMSRPAQARIDIALKPLGMKGQLEVELRFQGQAFRRRPIDSLLLGRANLAQLKDLRCHDQQGAIAIKLKDEGGSLRLVLERTQRGTLQLRYTLRTATDIEAVGLSRSAVDPTRMRANVENVLALPSALGEPKQANPIVDVHTVVDTSELRGRDAASSWGIGPRHNGRLPLGLLKQGFIVAGELGSARFDQQGARDRSIAMGIFGFDPRQIGADMAVFRSYVGQTLGQPDRNTLNYVWTSDARAPHRFEVRASPVALLIGMPMGAKWEPRMRIRVAQAIVKRWLGGRLWLSRNGRKDDTSTRWFDWGVARWFSATSLLHSGLLSLRDYQKEVNGSLAYVATAKQRGESYQQLSTRMQASSNARALIAARGMLYALELDARLRKNKRSLVGILRRLLVEAKRAQRWVASDRWHREVDKAYGSPLSKSLFDSWVSTGKSIRPSSHALGSCYRSGQGNYIRFDLGFDLERTVASTARKPIGLSKQGAAAKAGLLLNDTVKNIFYQPGDTTQDVRLRVVRNGKPQVIRYKPAGKSFAGPRFIRNGKISDDACAW